MTPPRGNPRGQQGNARGHGGGGTDQSRGPARNAHSIAAHVETIGVKRPGYGQIGRPINVTTNHFECDIPENIIHHYDGNGPPISSFIWLCSDSYYPSSS